ncbi:hypothetical protein D0862_02296 [Hortaea werneckii]|uniref:Uncharacterized protein n=1 Tax=Hortaea werneckii TaxID=91943 RepID=A0A3M7HKN1_HORWE|nr:hypothetical protein D0862_02296 [Hortaea werneckii]
MIRLASTTVGLDGRIPTGQIPPQDVFKRIEFPSGAERRKPGNWISILEAGLPSNLRSGEDDLSSQSLDVADCAELLVAAQSTINDPRGVDVLYHLCIVEGRWRAVVWLVKHLVETFASARNTDGRLSQLDLPWKFHDSLENFTQNPTSLELSQLPGNGMIRSAISPTLHELTDDLKPENLTRGERLKSAVLGQIWRSLGNMILACNDGVVKPEILEIIAYLHHQEIMPATIYSQKPGDDESAIQQPPTLHLLSSRILTSLSDAAWRAHEKAVAAEAREKGGAYRELRPEIPGMAYRVNVAGLRPEIWLELVLWACLHGGWIAEGSAILNAISRQSPRWKPLSWRSLVPEGDAGVVPNWDKLDYLFNTRTSSSMDQPNFPAVDVKNTISNEVVDAYVDALLSVINVGAGNRGIYPQYVLSSLNVLKKFLERSGFTFSGGSWETVALRFVESRMHQGINNHELDQLRHLASRFGHDSTHTRAKPLPDYVTDASAFYLGLCHQAIKAEVKAGNLDAALGIFKTLQDYTDNNKRQAVEEFFALIQKAPLSAEENLFASSSPQVDFPAFDLQIPPSLLGSLLELITETGSASKDRSALQIGKWMVYSSDVDRPLIPEDIYTHPNVAAALIKLASETVDYPLLAKVINARSQENEKTADGPKLPTHVAQAFLDAQVRLHRWQPAARILQYMRSTEDARWNVVNLSLLGREMILLRHSALDGDQDSERNLSRAQGLFTSMIRQQDEDSGSKVDHKRNQATCFLIMLGAIDSYWARFCLNLRSFAGHHVIDLSPKSFINLLEAVTKVYGSAAGRRLLGIFWSHPVRQSQEEQRKANGKQMPWTRPEFIEKPQLQRGEVFLPGQKGDPIVIYGGIRPNILTVSTIFNQALDELRAQRAGDEEKKTDGDKSEVKLHASPDMGNEDAGELDLSPLGMVIWAARTLRRLSMDTESIKQELLKTLDSSEVDDLREELPFLFAEHENEADTLDRLEVADKTG